MSGTSLQSTWYARTRRTAVWSLCGHCVTAPHCTALHRSPSRHSPRHARHSTDHLFVWASALASQPGSQSSQPSRLFGGPGKARLALPPGVERVAAVAAPCRADRGLLPTLQNPCIRTKGSFQEHRRKRRFKLGGFHQPSSPTIHSAITDYNLNIICGILQIITLYYKLI